MRRFSPRSRLGKKVTGEKERGTWLILELLHTGHACGSKSAKLDAGAESLRKTAGKKERITWGVRRQKNATKRIRLLKSALRRMCTVSPRANTLRSGWTKNRTVFTTFVVRGKDSHGSSVRPLGPHQEKGVELLTSSGVNREGAGAWPEDAPQGGGTLKNYRPGYSSDWTRRVLPEYTLRHSATERTFKWRSLKDGLEISGKKRGIDWRHFPGQDNRETKPRKSALY